MTTTPIAAGLHAVAGGPVDVFRFDAPDGLVPIDAGLPDATRACDQPCRHSLLRRRHR